MENSILSVLDDVEQLPVVARHIVQHDMSSKYSENVFSDMVMDALASGAYNKKAWENYLLPYEEMVLFLREKAGETGLKTKSGKWKLSKVSHNSTYRSNKSVIGNALDKGIRFYSDEGKLKSKGEIERELKGETTTDGAAERVRKTPYQRCLEAANVIKKLKVQLDVNELEDIRQELSVV